MELTFQWGKLKIKDKKIYSIIEGNKHIRKKKLDKWMGSSRWEKML